MHTCAVTYATTLRIVLTLQTHVDLYALIDIDYSSFFFFFSCHTNYYILSNRFYWINSIYIYSSFVVTFLDKVSVIFLSSILFSILIDFLSDNGYFIILMHNGDRIRYDSIVYLLLFIVQCFSFLDCSNISNIINYNI